MDNRVLRVPVSLLLDADANASAKAVWMARRLQPSATEMELVKLTGLTRQTVRSGLRQTFEPRGGTRVQVPAALLAERSIGPQAKVLYGVLQAIPGARGNAGSFTYTSLCAFTGLGRNTLKLAIRELTEATWIQVTQPSRLSPIQFALGSPTHRRSLAEVALAKRHLKRAKFSGEAIMQEYLSLLIDSMNFTDNARPGFLDSPLTSERLELDRFYPPNFAVEFNGAQHYRATGRYTQEEADTQHFRDLLKAGLCLYAGIHLVIIHPEDLSLQGIARKIGNQMPLRDLAGHEPLIELLEEASLSYRAAARR